jgi:hypothetical protein
VIATVALLGALALQSPTPAANRHACASTIVGALRRDFGPGRVEPKIDTAIYGRYGLATFHVKGVYFTASAWLRERGPSWCVLGTSGDQILIEDAVAFGVPERTAQQLLDRHSAAMMHRSAR